MFAQNDLFAGVLPFFHTAEERSFRRAAERLGVTPAAVSKAVRKLEDGLGVRLLARTSRAVALTPEGAQFHARCRDAITNVLAARDIVSESRRLPRGEVHLSLAVIVGRVIVPELTRLAARYPGLAFRVSMTDRVVGLADEHIDVAVRVGVHDDSTLVSRLLRRPRWVTVASPALAARIGPLAHPDDLARCNCLQFVLPNGRPRPFAFVDRRTERPIVPKIGGNLRIDHGEMLLEAAMSGLGVVQVLDFMVGPALRDGRLVEVLAPYAGEGPPIHAACLPERQKAPNVKAVMELLTGVFDRMDQR